MAGAIGIVFGLCVLSFTLGAALMYVVLRRHEDAAGVSSPSSADEPVERMWVEKPAAVEPVDEDYDSRPIHRNPVMGLPQLNQRWRRWPSRWPGRWRSRTSRRGKLSVPLDTIGMGTSIPPWGNSKPPNQP